MVERRRARKKVDGLLRRYFEALRKESEARASELFARAVPNETQPSQPIC